MDTDVPIIKSVQDPFVPIPSSARFAIILPTGRWNSMAQSIIGSLTGFATEEVVVLIADNSEDAEKREFLKKIRGINSNILAISHEKNIGATGNFNFLLDWSKKVEFIAMMGDDDWISPSYHVDAYRTLRDNRNASCAEVGTTFVDLGDGKLINITQPPMCGNTPIERMRHWNGVALRATMYNASRRTALEAAYQFIKTAPIYGHSLVEDVYELNRLALGDFQQMAGSGCFVHYPHNFSQKVDINQQQYNLLYKDQGLQFPFVYFAGLSTAILCAMFLLGNSSPIADTKEKIICGQYVFRYLFTTMFLPRFAGEASQETVAILFKNYPEAMNGFIRYSTSPFTQQPVFDQGVIDWFIEVIKVFEKKPPKGEIALSEQFRNFTDAIFVV